MGTATISEKGGDQERGEVRPGGGLGAPDGLATRPISRAEAVVCWARSTTTAST